MLNDVLKVSPHGSFKVTQLCASVAICEAIKGGAAALASRDRYGWGNGTETEPAFLVYLGCKKDEVKGYIRTLNTFYRCEWCEVRSPKHLKGFEAEIKIRGMQRYTDCNTWGLDHLVESQEWKEFGCSEEEYNHYTTGYMPRW